MLAAVGGTVAPSPIGEADAVTVLRRHVPFLSARSASSGTGATPDYGCSRDWCIDADERFVVHVRQELPNAVPSAPVRRLAPNWRQGSALVFL